MAGLKKARKAAAKKAAALAAKKSAPPAYRTRMLQPDGTQSWPAVDPFVMTTKDTGKP